MNNLEESIVDEIRDNTVSQSSKNVYKSSCTRFLSWLIENKPDLVCQELKDLAVLDGIIDKEKITQYINESIRNPDPIDFERLEN
jgi:hypothetical protein